MHDFKIMPNHYYFLHFNLTHELSLIWLLLTQLYPVIVALQQLACIHHHPSCRINRHLVIYQ